MHLPYFVLALTPLEYVREHVSVTSARKLLYGCIYNKIKNELSEDQEVEIKLLPGTSIIPALNLMMGKDLSEKQSQEFHELIGWKDDDQIDFKTFCGLCALCERLLAPEYCVQFPGKKADPCHEVRTQLR